MTDTAAPAMYDSDEEPPPEDSGDKFLWRLDPSESHSDFVIEIDSSPTDRAPENVQVDKYHVHKNTLALGPRKSEYFANLLQGVFAETSRGVCRILLDPVAAKAFPALLDYLYGAPELDCLTDSATALHFMGQYFGVRRLRWQARQFWMADLCLENCATYYQHAVLFGDERVLRRIQVTLGSEQLLDLSVDSEMVKVMDPQFLLTTLQTADLVVADSASLSLHTSILVALVLERCVGLDDDSEEDENDEDEESIDKNSGMDAELFFQLTDRSYLPEIDASVALKLLQLERTIVNPPDDTLTSLQQRCIQSLAQNWQVMKLNPCYLETLRRISSPILMTELLAHALTFAKEVVSMQRAKVISVTAQNSNLTRSLRAAEEETSRLESSLRRKLVAVQKWRTCYEASELRIRELEEELKRFRPLPTRDSSSYDESTSENAPNGLPVGSGDSVRFLLKRRGVVELERAMNHPLYYYAHDS